MKILLSRSTPDHISAAFWDCKLEFIVSGDPGVHNESD
jgi:hypothetical protein